MAIRTRFLWLVAAIAISLLGACSSGTSTSGVGSSGAASDDAIAGTWTFTETSQQGAMTLNYELYLTFGAGATTRMYRTVSVTSGKTTTTTVDCGSGTYALGGGVLSITVQMKSSVPDPGGKSSQTRTETLRDSMKAELIGGVLRLTHDLDGSPDVMLMTPSTVSPALEASCPQ